MAGRTQYKKTHWFYQNCDLGHVVIVLIQIVTKATNKFIKSLFKTRLIISTLFLATEGFSNWKVYYSLVHKNTQISVILVDLLKQILRPYPVYCYFILIIWKSTCDILSSIRLLSVSFKKWISLSNYSVACQCKIRKITMADF